MYFDEKQRTIGHYTAICLRVRQTYVVYNNLKKKEYF